MNIKDDKKESLMNDIAMVKFNHQLGEGSQTYHSQIYRECTLGNSLIETIQEFLQAGKINMSIANRLLYQYDESIQKKLKNNLRNTVS